MDRRKILKYAAYTTGAALSAPLISSVLIGCKSEATDNLVTSTLHFFNTKEASLVKELVDLILPKTDSPSASDVGVDGMIDTMVGTVYLEEDKANYKKGFARLVKYLEEQGIADLDLGGKLKVLQTLDTSKEESLKDVREAYLDLKQQTIAYYLTSEEIGTKFLNYLPVPGAYEACITLEEAGGKAWAL